MPFEGDITKIAPPVIETPAQRTIRLARELLATPDKWARTWERDDARCILGALRYVHNGSALKPGTGGAQRFVLRVLKRRGYTGITTFNDFHASHASMLAVLDAAYEAAGKPSGAKLDLSAIPRMGEARPRRAVPPSWIQLAAHVTPLPVYTLPKPAPSGWKQPPRICMPLLVAKFALNRA